MGYDFPASATGCTTMGIASPRSRDASGTGSARLRLVALAGLFLAEFLLVSLRVDAYALAAVDADWAQLLAYAGQFSRFGLGFVAAALIAAWPRLALHWQALDTAATRHRWGLPLLLQLAGFALFYFLSLRLFVDAGAGIAWPWLLVLAWVAGAAVLLMLALACLAPLPAWRQVFVRERRTLLLAVAVGALIWLFAHESQQIWGPLAEMTFRVSGWMLHAIYPSAEIVADLPNRTLGTRAFRVNIAPACSGYEGIGLIVGFLGLYLAIFRRELRFPRALLLLPLGVVAIWLLNALRIALLIAIGSEWSKDVALGGFHSQAGWIVFTVVALVLVRAADRSPFFARAPTNPRPAAQASAPTDDLAAAMLVPLIALLAATLVGTAFSAGFDWLYPLRVAAVLACLYRYRALLLPRHYRPAPTPVLAGVLVYLVWMGLVPPDPAYDAEFSAHLGDASSQAAGAWLLLRTMGSAITVPIAEELAFRGYLASRLGGHEPVLQEGRPYGWFAVAGSSLAFGLLHGDWIAGTAAGFVYAWVRNRRGSVIDAIIAHMTTNALISAQALLFGAWVYW